MKSHLWIIAGVVCWLGCTRPSEPSVATPVEQPGKPEPSPSNPAPPDSPGVSQPATRKVAASGPQKPEPPKVAPIDKDIPVAATGLEKKSRTEKEIREELDEAKKRVEELEEELSALAPAEEVKPRALPDDNFKVGEAYYLFNRNVGAAVKVLEVVDEESAIVQLEFGSTAYPQKLLMLTPTKGMVDGQLYQAALRSAWKVTGTKKVGGRTVFVMEPVKLSREK